MIADSNLTQKIRQGTSRLYLPLPKTQDLPSLCSARVLIDDATFRNEVAPESDPLKWRALSCRSFNSYLVVVHGCTYWGSPTTTQWAIKTLEGARPAFPHPDDI